MTSNATRRRELIMDGVYVVMAVVSIMMIGFFLGYAVGRTSTLMEPHDGKVIIEHRYPEDDNGTRH